MRRLLSWFLLPSCAVAFLAVGAGAAGDGNEVTYLEAAEVATAFAKGAPLLEVGAYKVHASRRDQAGMAEIHDLDTDILYVLEGSATIVTGGTLNDGRRTAPNEVRGADITGGETRLLAKGDVMVVPNGTPHWFKEVTPPFLYYVVKVTAEAGKS